MATLIQVRRDLASNWTVVNPTLSQGEIGFELDSNKVKIGDGITDWINLPYLFGGTSVAQNSESLVVYAVDPTTRQDGTPLQEGDIYYNTTDDSLYAYNGSAWIQVAGSGGASSSDNIRASAVPPTTDLQGNPLSSGDVYFDTTDGVTYVYDGSTWAPIASGTTSVQQLAAAPTSATAGDVYYDTTTNEMMVYDGTQWKSVNETTSIQTLAADPTPATTGDTYYNTTTNQQMIYDGTNWVPVDSGVASSLWTEATAPTTRTDGSALQEGDVYFNSTTNVQYIHDGTQWNEVTGSASSIPASPTAPTGASVGDVYYNTVTGEMQVYNGTTWENVDSKDADSIRTSATVPTVASDGSALADGDVYYNTTDGVTYIYSGGAFEPIAAGTTSFNTAVANPTPAQEGDTYYNTITNKQMIYDGTSWVEADTNTVITANVFNAATGNLTITDSDGGQHIANLDGRYPTTGDMNVAIIAANSSQIISDLADVDTSTVAPIAGQVLKWNGSNWVPANDITAGGGGLDADTLDGLDSTYYLNYNNLANQPAIPANLNDLSDVNAAAPNTGDALVWDGVFGYWKPVPQTQVGIQTLAGLTDTNVGTPVGGNVLMYNSATNKWVAAAANSAISLSLNDLTDVNSSGAVAGNYIVYNGTNWTTTPPPSYVETVTTLALSGNSLNYTDENGTTNNIDLAGYLDNVNLGRVVSGSVSGDILTLTRDDATTISINVTALNNANSATETTTTLVDNGNNTITYTNEAGAVTTISVGGTETVTTFVDNGDGTYTYTSEDGTVTTTAAPGAETVTSLVDNADGSFTYTNEAGSVVTYTSPVETLTSLSLATNTLTYVDEAGNSTNIDLSLYLDDTNLARVTSGTLDGATGIATFTRDDATTFTVDMSALISDIDTVAELTDVDLTTTPQVDGDVLAWDATASKWVPVAAGESIIPGTHVGQQLVWKGTSWELSQSAANFMASAADTASFEAAYAAQYGMTTPLAAADLSALHFYNTTTGTVWFYDINTTSWTDTAPSFTETVTTFTDNGDGTYTYTSEDGTITTTAAPGAETVTTLVDNGDNTLTYTSENGTVTTFDAGAVIPDGTIAGQSVEWNVAGWTATAPKAAELFVSGADATYETFYQAMSGVAVSGGEMFYNGSEVRFYQNNVDGWASLSTVQNIDDLGDVDTSTAAPTDGQVLTWDNANSIWVPQTPQATNNISVLSASTDLDYRITFQPSTGVKSQIYVDSEADGLTWNPSTNILKVKGNDVVDAGDSIDKLADVDTTTAAPTDGQVLSWDNTASNWVPATIASPSLDVVQVLPGVGGTDTVGATYFSTQSGTVSISPAVITNVQDSQMYTDQGWIQNPYGDVLWGSQDAVTAFPQRDHKGTIYIQTDTGSSSGALVASWVSNGVDWMQIGSAGGGSIPDGTAFGQQLWWNGGSWALSPDYATAGFQFDGYTGTFITDSISTKVNAITSAPTVQLGFDKTYHTLTATSAMTIAPDTGTLTSGIASSCTLELTTSGGPAITWGSQVKWPEGTPPTINDGTHIFTFVSRDGGTTVYANYLTNLA